MRKADGQHKPAQYMLTRKNMEVTVSRGGGGGIAVCLRSQVALFLGSGVGQLVVRGCSPPSGLCHQVLLSAIRCSVGEESDLFPARPVVVLIAKFAQLGLIFPP